MYTEFAEAMEEMVTFLLGKTALDNDDDDSGKLSESISTLCGSLHARIYS